MTEGGEGGAGDAVLAAVEGPGRHLAGEARLPSPHWLGGGAGPGGRHADGGGWHEGGVRGLQDGGAGGTPRRPGHLPVT